MASCIKKTIRPVMNGIRNGFFRCKATKVSAAAAEDVSMGSASESIFQRENKYGAHNYHPLPVALCRAQGKILKLSIVFRIFHIII